MIWTRLFRAGGAPSARTSRRASVLRVEKLEDRSVPATFAFTPNAVGGGNFNPFPGFTGRIETASADINGDGTPDIITAEGPGPGSLSEVRIFDGAAARRGQAVLIADFFPYGNAAGASQTPGFDGGVFVAAGNFTGNRFADLVVSTGAGGQGHVKVFEFDNPTTGQFLGSNPTLLTSFIVYPGFQGAVTVAAVNRAGLTPLLVTASGAGTSTTDVRVFTNAAAIGGIPPGGFVHPAAQFFAFPGFLGGVDIAAGGSPFSPQLYLTPSVGTPQVSVFNLFPTAGGGVAASPGLTFFTGTGIQSDIRLGSAVLDNTGFLDVLTSFVTPTTSSPVLVFSLVNGGPVQLPDLTPFAGFGFFDNSWVFAGAFTSTGVTTTTTPPTTTTTTPVALGGTSFTQSGLSVASSTSTSFTQSGLGVTSNTGVNSTTTTSTAFTQSGLGVTTTPVM